MQPDLYFLKRLYWKFYRKIPSGKSLVYLEIIFFKFGSHGSNKIHLQQIIWWKLQLYHKFFNTQVTGKKVQKIWGLKNEVQQNKEWQAKGTKKKKKFLKIGEF